MQALKRNIKTRLRPIPLVWLFALFFSTALASDLPAPVTEEMLGTLGLDREYHKCLSVADGDTVTLEGLGTVRFIGVDTPEKNHPQLPVQFMSEEAGAFIERICLGKKIRLAYDPYDKDKRGNYGRVLGYAYLEDGTFLQEELIKNGLAIAYTKYPLDDGRKAQFLAWEQEARNRQAGLWQDDGFSEVLWILAQRQPLLQLTKISKDHCSIGFGNRVLKPVHCGDIANMLEQLYRSIYEFSPRELQAELTQMRYHTASVDTEQSPIFALGMAHNKWGIIYKNYALARVLPERLDEKLIQLFGWIETHPEEALGNVLLKNRYRFIPAKRIHWIEPHKVAKTFLTVYEATGPVEDTIPWDLAGNHIGEYMSVEGKIVRTHNSGKACFLNFHNNWTRYFSVVIFDNVLHRFPEKPEEFYREKVVRVKGKIKTYRGRPEIVLNSPHQIEIIDHP